MITLTMNMGSHRL